MGASMTTLAQQRPYVHIPDTVSPQAQAFLRTLQDPALMPAFPEPDNLAGWEKVGAFAEADGKAKSAPLLQRYEHTVTEGRLGGVPVLDVRPKNWKDNGKVTVYTHGGAHVMYSAASTLGRAVVFAHATGLRALSVDYTVAPLAKYNQMSDEVITAIRALLKDGQRLADTAIYGDSSGGGLAAAVVLKMRNQGLGMPAAAVLLSPWLDVTPSGDTETTLHDADPNQLYEKHGKQAAAAFADPRDQKDPYASPAYAERYGRLSTIISECEVHCEGRHSNEDAGNSAGDGSVGPSPGHAARMGSEVGGRLCPDDDKSVDER